MYTTSQKVWTCTSDLMVFLSIFMTIDIVDLSTQGIKTIEWTHGICVEKNKFYILDDLE